MSAIASHSTATTDAEWDGPANKARLPSARGALRAAFAWVDPAGDPDVKESYKFIHHMVSAGGDVGAANVRACTSAIGVLNGGRGGTVIPDADKAGVWRHLARHLRDAGVEEVPELKSANGFVPAPSTRAYSVLHIKAVDMERRTLTGTATTPRPDRLGDIIEPLGVTFKNPLPLLLYHDTTQPVGTVKFDKPTEAGITFTASLPAASDSARLRDRIDEAWESVRAGLIRGVSIGFRVLNDAMDWMKDTGGWRYRETEVLELSLVAIPANQDATISVIKALDVPRPAASGAAGRVPLTPSGAADRTKDARSMKNTSQELTAKRAELQTKQKRLQEIREGAEAEVLSDELKLEAKGLASEITDLTDTCEQLQAIERAAGQLAAPLVAKDVDSGTKARDPHVGAVEVKSVLPPGVEFARLMICKMAAFLSQGNTTALEVARSRFPDYPRIQIALKAAVTPATTTDPTWAGALVVAQTLYTEFIDFLRPRTILGKFGVGDIPNLTRVPFNIRVVGQTSGGAGYWVGQGKPKPLTKFAFAPTSLGFAKAANIAVFSDELARFSNPSAETLIRDGLAKALVERMDIDFIDPNKAIDPNVSPASITNGIAAIVSAGTDATAVRADLAQLFQAFITANNPLDQGVFIMSQSLAMILSLMRNALGQREFPDINMLGGKLEGLPVITSQYAAFGSPATHIVVLVNAGDIFMADDGQVSVDVTREASLEMDDTPEGSPSSSGATMVSLFQANLIGLRAERYVNWIRRRDSGVAWIDNVAWGTGSP